MTTVSVCIRGSRAATLPQAVESVLAQGWDDVEVLVGDEHGTLATVVEGFADSRVRHRPFETSPGPSAHARTLMNEAEGRYLVLMDDDDWWLPGFLDATIARLEADSELGVVFTAHFNSAAGVLVTRDTSFAEGRHDGFLTEFLRGEAPIGVSFAVIRREAWEESERAKPLQDDAAVDAMVWMRVAQAGWPFYFVPDRLGVYRMHSAQMSHRAEFVRDRAVRVWQLFSFDAPEAEMLRCRRLREAYLERANLRLRGGRVRAAFADVREARATFRKPFGARDALALLGARRGPARLMARYTWIARIAFAVWPVLTHFERWAKPHG